MAIQQVWHVCLTVEDIERSVAFYRDIVGLQVIREVQPRESLAFRSMRVLDDPEGYRDTGPVKLLAAFLGFPSDGFPTSYDAPTFLDIVQYVDPPTKGSAYPSAFNRGLTRFALQCEDVGDTYREILARGPERITPLEDLGDMSDTVGHGYFSLIDPDGILVEFVGPCGRQG